MPCARHDALCPTVTDRVDESVLATEGRRVQLIGNFGVGYNHIDIDAAKRLGIRVSNTPDVLTGHHGGAGHPAAADDHAARVVKVNANCAPASWIGWRPTHMMGQSLNGKTLGLIGFGRIAQATARKAHQAFGMRIAYNGRRRASSAIEQETRAEFIDSVDELVATSDVVSLHCPGGAATFHLINAERLRLMQRHAVLINTARGTGGG